MSEIKYHINPETGNPNKCTATVKSCRYVVDGEVPEHYETKEDAKDAYEVMMEQKFKDLMKLNKIDEEKNEIRNIEPVSYQLNFGVLKHRMDEYFFHYDYDYEDDSLYGIDENTVRLTAVNFESIVDEIVNYDDTDKEEITEILKNNGVDNKYNYTIDVISNSSGVDVEIVLYDRYKVIQDLENFYYSKDNAVDKDGVLEYVRSKGISTEGLSPIQALKEQLSQENPGRSHKVVDNADSLTLKRVSIDNITAGAVQRLDNVDEHEPKSFNNAHVIAGVVYFDHNSRKYRLIDGYHRMKFFNNNNIKEADYIVIS